jgi:hypothetical protein
VARRAAAVAAPCRSHDLHGHANRQVVADAQMYSFAGKITDREPAWELARSAVEYAED